MQRHVHGPLSPIKGYLLIRDISSVLSFYDCFSNPVADRPLRDASFAGSGLFKMNTKVTLFPAISPYFLPKK
jgi:hypothetical protein